MSEIISADMYDGKYRVQLNIGNHRYKIGKLDGYNVTWIDASPDGVTTLCGAVIPKFLDDWAGRVDVGYVRKGWPFKTEKEFQALCDEAETEHQRIRDSAGERGSAVHDAIEKKLTGKPFEVPTDPQAQAGWEAFCKWEQEGVCEVLEAERLIFHDDLFYCGKTDLVGHVYDRLSVLDFKTGSGFYEDQPYQLTGYAVAIEKENPGMRIEDGYIIHLDKRTGKPKTYHIKIDDGMKEAWLNAVLHYKQFKKVRKMVKEMKDGFPKRAS